jgi:hypothetical protein
MSVTCCQCRKTADQGVCLNCFKAAIVEMANVEDWKKVEIFAATQTSHVARELRRMALAADVLIKAVKDRHPEVYGSLDLDRLWHEAWEKSEREYRANFAHAAMEGG